MMEITGRPKLAPAFLMRWIKRSLLLLVSSAILPGSDRRKQPFPHPAALTPPTEPTPRKSGLSWDHIRHATTYQVFRGTEDDSASAVSIGTTPSLIFSIQQRLPARPITTGCGRKTRTPQAPSVPLIKGFAPMAGPAASTPCRRSRRPATQSETPRQAPRSTSARRCSGKSSSPRHEPSLAERVIAGAAAAPIRVRRLARQLTPGLMTYLERMTTSRARQECRSTAPTAPMNGLPCLDCGNR